jgi:hypothetical protein
MTTWVKNQSSFDILCYLGCWADLRRSISPLFVRLLVQPIRSILKVLHQLPGTILTCYLFSPHHLMFLNFPLLHQMLVNTSACFHLVHSAGRWVTSRNEPSSSLSSDVNCHAAVFQPVGHHTNLQVIKTLNLLGTLLLLLVLAYIASLDRKN